MTKLKDYIPVFGSASSTASWTASPPRQPNRLEGLAPRVKPVNGAERGHRRDAKLKIMASPGFILAPRVYGESALGVGTGRSGVLSALHLSTRRQDLHNGESSTRGVEFRIGAQACAMKTVRR